MDTNFQSAPSVPKEGYIPADRGELYYREIGSGRSIILLHGGPDFDHSYLLPEMDRLSDSFRLIYYDQRGRGRSAGNVQPEDISMQSEVEDLEILRVYFELNTAAVLGHSWGGLLAMEYAIRRPEHVSHLILMNTAPASHADYMLLREDRRRNAAADLETLNMLSSTSRYKEGDVEADARYYRVHFRMALRQPQYLEKVVKSLRQNFTEEGIRRARAIESRLYDETWFQSDYDLFPKRKALHIPTLVLHGDYDLVPVECAAHIAHAIPASRFVLLKECGHFSYLECPDEIHQEIVNFLHEA